jgi:hypothetical protein
VNDVSSRSAILLSIREKIALSVEALATQRPATMSVTQASNVIEHLRRAMTEIDAGLLD